MTENGDVATDNPTLRGESEREPYTVLYCTVPRVLEPTWRTIYLTILVRLSWPHAWPCVDTVYDKVAHASSRTAA